MLVANKSEPQAREQVIPQSLAANLDKVREAFKTTPQSYLAICSKDSTPAVQTTLFQFFPVSKKPERLYH